MIKSLAIALTIPLLTCSVFAQAPLNPPPEQEQTFHAGPGQPPPREILEKLQSMTPEQRQAFLQSHPRVNQFIQNHPDYAQHLANGSGSKDSGQARVNEINQREQIEQQRINQGLRDGTITPADAAKLQNRLNQIKQQEAADLARNNGHLTKEEARRLNREENREDRKINQDDHEIHPGGQHPKGGGK